MPERTSIERVTKAGGNAFDLISQSGKWVPHPFAFFAKEPALSEGEGAGTTTAYTTGGVERATVAPAASPPTPSTSSGQALAKNREGLIG